MNIEQKEALRQKLAFLYPDNTQEAIDKVFGCIERWSGKIDAYQDGLSEKDSILITYADTLQAPGEAPLQTLRHFVDAYLKDKFSGVHILPAYPYTADDGFSVSDYMAINPELGTWRDIDSLKEHVDLMLDAVINHCSKSHAWFQGYLQGNERYRDYFIERVPGQDYSMVTRPRALPLFTVFQTAEGEKEVWTTFSDDQIDLNYKSIDLMVDILEVLLFYARRGARLIRLDAVCYIWKELGTTCAHLPETHALVQIIRLMMDCCAKGRVLVSETNVPHLDNIGYLGDGTNEAHMVYQFPLPPLVGFSILSGNAAKLSKWAAGLEPLPPGAAYFNFLSSHDGIGLRPVEGILEPDEVQLLLDKCREHGGEVNYKNNADGTVSPYELNITYLNLLSSEKEDPGVSAARLMAASCILLSMAGVPGVYIHSLLGSQNDVEGMRQSGINRRINREKLDYATLCGELQNIPLRKNVFERYLRLLELRREHPAFSPMAAQRVLFLDERLFCLERKAGDETVYILVNVSNEAVVLKNAPSGVDLLSGGSAGGTLEIKPYGYHWICSK